MIRDILNIYYQNNGKEDPDHMYDVFLIRIQQNVGDIHDLAYNDQSLILEIYQ